MSIGSFYSKRVLSLRQKVILFGSVSICFCAFIYTYFACEFLCHSMLVSIADLSPHIRIHITNQNVSDVEAILGALSNDTRVSRVDKGVLAIKNIYIETPKPIETLGQKPETFFSGYKKVCFVAYSFDNDEYRPPIMLENVYSSVNRQKTIDSPKDEPIRIISDQSPEEQRINWAIISNNLTSVIHNGPIAFGDTIQMTCQETGKSISLTTAGYLSNNPLQVVSDSSYCMVILRKSSLEQLVTRKDCTDIIDISVKDRRAADVFAQDIRRKYKLENVETWMDKNASAISFLSGIKTTAYSGMTAIVLLSIIGINVILSMLVIDKSKQLAILYAIGQNTFQLRCIFLRIGLLIGFRAIIIGGTVGILLSILSMKSWRSIVDNFCHTLNTNLVYSPLFIGLSAVFLLVLCCLASWLPSRRIVSSDPINTIRSN